MKKTIITLIIVFIGFGAANAQVGIGTTSPATTLDVRGANDTGAPGALDAVDGISVPVVTDDMTSTTTNGTKVSQLVYSNNAASTGYYYWDGSAWQPLGGGSTPSAPSIRDNVTTATLFPSDLNGYVIVTATPANPFDLSSLTPSASAGDIITLVTYAPFTVSNNDLRSNSDTSPGNFGTGMKYLYTGSDWVSLVSF